MAWLPPSMASETASAKALRQYSRFVPGEYILLVKNVEYEDVKTQDGTDEHAIICRQVVVDSKPNPKGQPAGISPNSVGEQVDYFIPDWGKSKVYTKPKFKAWVLGLVGRDEKSIDVKQLEETIGLIGGPRQLARGMYIRVIVSQSSKTNEDGEAFMNYEWLPVPGENVPDAPSVIARRKDIEAQAEGQTPATTSNGAAAVGGSTPPSLPGASAPPALPGNGNPMDGWTIHPGTVGKPEAEQFFYREDKAKKGAYKKSEILAGMFSRES